MLVTFEVQGANRDSEETNTVSTRFMLHTMEIDQIFGLLAYLQNFHGLSWWTLLEGKSSRTYNLGF
jgi:hypothetical protein